MNILISVYLFVIGLAFGSFALAMVDRMKAGKDWVKGRSECASCKQRLGAKDLVPVLSWLSTRGRCRYCKAKLTIAYPLVEIGCGVAFLLSYLYMPYELSGTNIALFVIWLLSLVIMVALVIFDARWFILPNKLVYPLALLAIAHRLIFVISNTKPFSNDLLSLGLSLFVSAGVFLILYIASSGKWIGDGDIRLGVAMGLFLPGGIESWLVIFIASVLGLIVGLLFTPKKGKNKKKLMTTKIPFGPMLILGLFIVYLFGSHIIDWYSSSFLYL